MDLEIYEFLPNYHNLDFYRDEINQYLLMIEEQIETNYFIRNPDLCY